MPTQRFRLRQVFWLDLHKEDERQLADQVAILKDKRTFAKTVRDGIRLILDLYEGKIDVLLELFPFVQLAIQQTAQQTAQAKAGAAEIQAVETHRDDRWLLEQIEHLLNQGPGIRGELSPMTGGGSRGFKLSRLDDDDDLDTLVIQKSTATGKIGENFFNNMMSLQ
ncbi:MAG TPA: hypothetical protein VHL11_24450 [Phototrophicaceae bacterium]|jgi:hypothetical protein|nr:hypothetical protein [Phototrophicaceae bacterium]